MGWTSILNLVDSVYEHNNRIALVKIGVFSPTIQGASNGTWLDCFLSTGGTYSGTAGVAAQLNDSSTNAINAGPSVSPSTKHLLNSSATRIGTNFITNAILCDFLLYYPSLNATGTPTTLDNTITLPRYTNGVGVMGFAVAHTLLGNSVDVDININYDSNENTGQSVSNIVSAFTTPGFTDSGPATMLFKTSPQIPFISLGSNNSGIKKINSYTINSTGTTGTLAFVLVKPICNLFLFGGKVNNRRSFINSLPKIEDNACLGLLIQSGVQGSLASSVGFNVIFEFGW